MKYRFFPTGAQAAQLAQTFGCARYVWNWGLEARAKAWRQDQTSLNYHATANLMTELKKTEEAAFLNEVSRVVLQQTLRNLETAYTNFFEQRVEYSKFKSRKSRQSVRSATTGFTYNNGRIKLAKHSEPLNISWSHPLPEDAKLVNVTIIKDTAHRYVISVLVKTDLKPLKKIKPQVGIDVGIKTLATTSDGQKLENPHSLNGYPKFEGRSCDHQEKSGRSGLFCR